ncbi:MAG: hypothetical protein L0Z68_05585 [Gammaproteobacteria bacterium]|nr:hypothetical protein [Gammaproteobacteria bacterium]
MISVPIAVNNYYFRTQLELFWFNHKATYGEYAARGKLRAVIVKRNTVAEQTKDICEWAGDIPHVMADAYFDVRKDLTNPAYLPINIQLGLSQVIAAFDDEQVIEVLDCDMFHLRPHPDLTVEDNELIVADIYEEWHLKSLTDHKDVIAPFFKNEGNYYNGGFVPIIGKAKTFKKLLPDWIELHKRIVDAQSDGNLQWWAGMYSLQAACENNAVRMRAMDLCYVPGINALNDDHYIAHYSVDQKFNKKTWPSIDVSSFEKNEYYSRVLEWMRHEKILAEDALPRGW